MGVQGEKLSLKELFANILWRQSNGLLQTKKDKARDENGLTKKVKIKNEYFGGGRKT